MPSFTFTGSCNQAMNIAHDKYHKIWLRSKGVIFFGTPHLGSRTAPVGELLGKIANAGWPITKPVRTDLINNLRLNSPTLKQIADDFVERASEFQITSFYEREKLSPFGTLVSK